MDNIVAEGVQEIKSNVNCDFFKEKTVLVTGGAGFIGSWLCDVLVSSGADVIAVDDLSTGRIKNIEHLAQTPHFKFIKSDICEFQAIQKIDCILHMAGHASPDEYQAHPIETLQTSSVGSYVMAELARKNDAILLFASTSEVYGDTNIIPTPETFAGNVNPVGPRSCYDEGKRYAEALFMAYYRKYHLDIKIPRIFNTYGPRLREDGLYGRVISRFIFQALKKEPITVYGNGKQTRSFGYITDTATGLLSLATCIASKGEAVNVGNTNEVTILELAKKIKEITQSRSAIVFHSLPIDDPKRRCPDINKMEKLSNWKPMVELNEGLKKTIEWFVKNQVTY